MIRSFKNATLTTADEVIDAVGGTLKASRLARASMPSVSGWRATGRLPSRTFLRFTRALAAQGNSAPPGLWGIDDPDEPPGES